MRACPYHRLCLHYGLPDRTCLSPPTDIIIECTQLAEAHASPRLLNASVGLNFTDLWRSVEGLLHSFSARLNMSYPQHSLDNRSIQVYG